MINRGTRITETNPHPRFFQKLRVAASAIACDIFGAIQYAKNALARIIKNIMPMKAVTAAQAPSSPLKVLAEEV